MEEKITVSQSELKEIVREIVREELGVPFRFEFKPLERSKVFEKIRQEALLRKKTTLDEATRDKLEEAP